MTKHKKDRHRRLPRPALTLLLASTLATGCGYGRIHELDEAALRARSEIEVQLRRRAELVPNLLATVQQYGAVGQELIAAVADSRASLVSAVRASDLGGMETWSAQLSEALARLQAAVSRDPELEGDQGYRLLRTQLETTEAEIEQAGQRYNEAVAQFNAYIADFPQLVTARLIGAGPMPSFEPGQRLGSEQRSTDR